MDPSASGSLVPEDFECSYCHERVALDADDKHLYTTLETAVTAPETPRTHLHCSELLLELPEFAAWQTASTNRLPTRCFGCERQRGDSGHEVDQSDEGIVYAVTSVLPYPSVVVYCPKSKEGVQPGPGTEMLGQKDAIEALETRAKASRIEWEHKKIVSKGPALLRRNTLKKKNRDTVAGPSTAAVSSTAGPASEGQVPMSGQESGADSKGKARASATATATATATEGTVGGGILKKVTRTVHADDPFRLSRILDQGFPHAAITLDDTGPTTGYAPEPSVGHTQPSIPGLTTEITAFQQDDEESQQTHPRCARCCCSKCFCM